MRSLGQTRFVRALKQLEAEGVLDRVILTSAASLRILGIRVYTRFIDLLAPNSYYFQKAEELNFSPRYQLEPVPLRLGDFQLRLGTVKGGLCSFRHILEPYNVYQEAEYRLDGEVRLIKLRPHTYVRRDCEEAIEKMSQRYDRDYWPEFYSYHKQIEAIDLGMRGETLKLGPQKFLTFED